MQTSSVLPTASRRSAATVVRQFAALLLVATAALLGVALAASPAHACSCKAGALGPDLEAADTVVVGTLEDATALPSGQAQLQVVVSRVFKGEVSNARMSVAATGGTCSFWSGSSEQRLLLVVNDGRVGACTGSQVATGAVVERVQAKLGVGQRLDPPAPPGAQRVTLETHQPRDFARLAAPGAAAALLGLLGLAVVSRVQKL